MIEIVESLKAKKAAKSDDKSGQQESS